MAQKRLFWAVVDKIEEKIASGEYVPGARLPPERVLAEEFGVSRPTIREAIIALEVRGKVEVKTSSGVYLLEQPEANIDNIDVSAFELTQARALVEGEAAALAAANITDNELILLEQTMIDMRDGDPEKADEDFHKIISNATRNKAMKIAVENFWELRESTDTVKEAYGDVCYHDSAARLKEHQMILDALKSRKPDIARAAMHAHFNRLINALFEASERRALEEVRSKSDQTRGLYSLENIR